MQKPASSDIRNVLAGLVLVGALSLAVVAWGIYDLRCAAWSHAATTATNLVTVLRRDVGRTFESYDLSLQGTLRALRSPSLGSIDAESRQQLLFDGSGAAESLSGSFVLDEQGRMRFNSHGAVRPEANFADRDYFASHRDDPNLGLYVSLPFVSRVSGDWEIAISRRVEAPDGRFGGVVVGAVSLSYFQRLFATLEIGTRGSITLVRTDGRLIDRMPLRPGDVGRDVSASPVFQQQLRGNAGLFESDEGSDGRPRLYAFTRVGQLPFVLSVNSGLSAIYADWKRRACITVACSLLLLGVGGWLLAVVRAQTRRLTRAERETARVAALFEACFASAADALFLVEVRRDGRLNYLKLNPACERLAQLTDEAARGRQPSQLFDPATARLLEEHYRTCAFSGEACSYAVVRELPSGRREWQTALSPIHDEAGGVTMILGSARDMTEHNRREADRLQAGKMEAVGRLTAGVAHDFNNHLQTIASSLETLCADFLHAPEAKAVAQIAHTAASSAALVTHRLLAFSRQQVLRPRRVNVTDLMNQTRTMFRRAALGPAVRFKVAVEPFTDDLLVDPAQAATCLLNLLLNAGEAMPDGGALVLHVRNAHPGEALFGELRPGRHVIIAVHDSGRGMDDATRALAFEPFYTTKSFGAGAGLGLSMAQGFCRQSGGDIRLLSGGEVGTRAELWLPAASANMQGDDEAQFNLATIGRGTGRLLLVEDEPEAAAALSATLVSGGFEVVAVTNAADGLARLRDRDPYDAVLTGSSMPDMSGADFLSHAAGIAPGLPMVLLTGCDPADIALPDLPRPVRLLRKPIQRTALLNTVRELVGERVAAQAAA